MELRIQILLNVEDLDTVKSLVFASPEYHQAYLTIRHDILSMYLQKSYNGLVDTKDAIAAIRTRGMYAIYPSNRQSIIALLDAWRRCDEIRHLNLSDDSKILPDRPANVAEVIQLLHLHKTAMFFLDDYCTHAECPQWMESTKWHNEIMPLQLSRTENETLPAGFLPSADIWEYFLAILISLWMGNALRKKMYGSEVTGTVPIIPSATLSFGV